MRGFAALGLLLALGSCSDAPDIKDCETQLLDSLKAPSTYKRVSVDSIPGFVSIEYDADNSYGAPIRDKAICQYKIVDGRNDPAQRTSAYNNTKTSMDALKKQYGN